MQADHDVVLVDLRGTGRSNPLVCTSVDMQTAPGRALDDLPDNAALTACRDRLAKNADLKQYTLNAAVLDLEAVRVALGYGKINVLAISYGTRLGLEYVRKFGTQVRALALSGVVAPSQVWGLTYPRTSQVALQRVFDACAAQPDCQKAFPGLSKDLSTALAALDKAPAQASVSIADNLPAIKVTVSRATFTRELAQFLLIRDDTGAIPLIVHQAATGDFMPFAALALQRHAVRPQAADGLQLSLACTHDAPLFTPAAVTASAQGTFSRDDRAEFLRRACAIWPHGTAAALTPITSAVPTLLISGSLDPLTPPSNAAAVAKTLSNSVQLVIENASHVPANACVNGAIQAFFKIGATTAVDASCKSALPPVKFVTSLQ